MLSQEFLVGLRVLAIVCTQWGDTGKGKFVDYFAADWADIIARGTGGANAGHTIRSGDREFVFHLLPSGMLHDKINIIGSGVAVDPGIVINELMELDQANISMRKLGISLNARLVLPQHIALDRVRESLDVDKIGTTGRGMGPVYTDHVARLGLVVNDLLNPDVFRRKLHRNLEEKIRVLKTYDPEIVRAVMEQEILGGGIFFHPKNIFDEDSIVDKYVIEYGDTLKEFIKDTDVIMRDALRAGKHILLEGAQGNMLSVDYGTYPYVTSSDCSVAGLAKGVGLSESDVNLALGIVKAFYMTRVGQGPFPTELGGNGSEAWCRRATRMSEVECYPDVSITDTDEHRLGVAVRRIGNEYGATTGRPRRTGWLDLPLLRYSSRITGNNAILTKLDVLDGIPEVKVCTAYIYQGPDYWHGEKKIGDGDRIEVAIPDLEVMRHCKPVYQTFPGWEGPLRGLRSFHQLPEPLQNLIKFFETATGIRATIASVGPDRDDTIVIRRPQLYTAEL